MGTDIQKFFGGHQLPPRDKLTEALAGFSAAKNSMLGKALLRLTKQGVWVFGMDNDVLKPGTRLIANPASLQSGFVAWWLGKIEQEIMQPLAMGPVDVARLGPVNSGSIPPGKQQPSGKGWEAQASVDLITQADIPLQLVYKASSMGGMRCILGLAGDIAFGMKEDPRRAFPILEVGVDSYQHKEFGTVYTPVLNVAGWLDENGAEVPELKQISQQQNSAAPWGASPDKSKLL